MDQGGKKKKCKYFTGDRPCGHTRNKKSSSFVTVSFNPFMNFIF